MSWGAFLAGHVLQLVLLAGLLVASAFFSGSETALFSLTGSQRHRLQHSSQRLARLAASLVAKPRALLNTLLLGNMLVNVAFSANAALLVLEIERLGAPRWQVALASVVPLLGLILFGEVTPKLLAYSVSERWARASALVVYATGRFLRPVILVLEHALISPVTRMLAPRQRLSAAISAEELAALMDLSARRGMLDSDTNALIQEILDLTDLRVCDIMVPRVDMIAYNVNDDRDGLVALFRRTTLRRIPVYDGDIDRILGLIHAKRLLLQPAAPLRDLAVKVPFVPEAANLERALLQFRVTRTQTAVVVDEYGGTAGLVTLEDVLEEIVGDISEPRDAEAEPPVKQVSPGVYLVAGNLAIHELADALHVDLRGRRISTIGGFLTSLLGRIPRVGDSSCYRNLRLTVAAMRGRRVGKVRLELAAGADADAGADGPARREDRP